MLELGVRTGLILRSLKTGGSRMFHIHTCKHVTRCRQQSHLLQSERGVGLTECLLVALLWMVLLLNAGAALAQSAKRDPNAPFNDAYDVLHGADLVGTWKGVVRGSSISQRDGVMSG